MCHYYWEGWQPKGWWCFLWSFSWLCNSDFWVQYPSDSIMFAPWDLVMKEAPCPNIKQLRQHFSTSTPKTKKNNTSNHLITLKKKAGGFKVCKQPSIMAIKAFWSQSQSNRYLHTYVYLHVNKQILLFFFRTKIRHYIISQQHSLSFNVNWFPYVSLKQELTWKPARATGPKRVTNWFRINSGLWPHHLQANETAGRWSPWLAG